MPFARRSTLAALAGVAVLALVGCSDGSAGEAADRDGSTRQIEAGEWVTEACAFFTDLRAVFAEPPIAGGEPVDQSTAEGRQAILDRAATGLADQADRAIELLDAFQERGTPTISGGGARMESIATAVGAVAARYREMASTVGDVSVESTDVFESGLLATLGGFEDATTEIGAARDAFDRDSALVELIAAEPACQAT